MATKTLDPYDVFVRHQIYVEGYKNNEEDQTDDIIDELITILLLLLLRTGKTDLGELTATELSALIAEFNRRASRLFMSYEARFTNKAKSFFVADFAMLAYVYKQFSDKTYKGPPANKLWAKSKNTIIPGIGIEQKNILKTFFMRSIADIVQLTKKAYAERWSLQQIAIALKGTKTNAFRDGFLNKLNNNLKTTINTYIQYLSNYASYLIGKALFDEYQWVSILDSRTTDICRSRDGNVYRYGYGPVPPAHYNCRSTITPVIDSPLDQLPTYYSWISRQPKKVTDDILGRSRADKLRSGELTSTDLSKFDGTRELTLDEFKGKRNMILTSTETDG